MSDIPIRPILAFLGADLTTERNGKMRCPFHGPDKNPSASVKDNYFKCFACDAHGDAIRLLMEQGGMEWSESYKEAKRLTGVEHEPRGEEPRSRGALSLRERLQRGNRPFVPPGRGRR